MADTSIEWTDATWNPVAGCTVISPGCTNCYAMRMAARLDAMGMKKYRGLTRKSGKRAIWTGKLRLDQEALGIPAGWKRPRRIFVNSMSDLFHEAVPVKFIAAVWDSMQAAPQHTFQILTKRPDRMAEITASLPVLPNVWLGTSVENSDYLGRIDDLRGVNAAVRFQWAIVGGESGPRSRPMAEEWVGEIEIACRKARAAFFFKQWGGVRKKSTGRSYRGRTFDEMPVNLD